MKSKKFFSVLCAAAILLSGTTSAVLLNGTGVTHAEEIIDEEIVSEETEPEETDPEETNPEETSPEEPDSEELTAPENLRYEDGYIVWDEVETASGKKAYGYYVQVYNDNNDDYSPSERYYTTRVEFDRFCYKWGLDFGEYQAKVCAFDESDTMTEWSSSIAVSYAPAFDAPANVRLHEEWDETIEWDEVEGAARYNIRIFNNDDERTLYIQTYTSYNSFTYKYYLNSNDLDTNGKYWISVQAMDKDYNASKWTEPILISHTEKLRLETPQNVRLDESGENVLWDEVEGATDYQICVQSYADYKNGSFWPYEYGSTTEPRYDNWKSIAVPFSKGQYEIIVWAYGEGYQGSYGSEPLTVDFNPQLDESIDVPEVRVEDNYLRWENVEGAVKYWMCISAYGEFLENEWTCLNGTYGTYCHIGNRLPEGTYETELFVVDENNNYNSKTFSFTLDTVHEETIWVPEMYYKFEELLWDYDQLRHDNTQLFWIRLKQGDTVVKLAKSWGGYFYGLPDLTDGEYSVDVCVYEHTDELGPWSEPLDLTKHGDSLFDKKNETTEEVERDPAGEGIPDEDRILSITINPAFNMKHKDGDDVELDLSKITIKANEIYDEEGLQRASEALGELIKGNKHYNLLDLTLLYDGEDFSNGYEGLVQVIIPIPAGHREKKFSCYRLTEVDGKMVKEEIPGEQTEDSYIIYLEHFSEYAMVGSGDEEEHTHVYGESWESDENGHWHVCECGEKSEITAHTFGEWTTTKEATETEKGEEARQCEICGYTDTRAIPEKDHTHVYGESWESDENGHWHVCECGEKSEITAHTFGEWITTKAATEDEEGEETRKCEICERSETRTVEKLTPADTSDTSAPDTSDTEQSPTDTTNNNTGNFYVPENTASTTEQTTVPPAEDVPSSQSTDNNTDTKTDITEQINTEEPSAETIQTTENGTVGNANDNRSDNSNNTGSVNPDKNINTGVALVAVPVAAIAAMGIIIFKKRK